MNPYWVPPHVKGNQKTMQMVGLCLKLFALPNTNTKEQSSQKTSLTYWTLHILNPLIILKMPTFVKEGKL